MFFFKLYTASFVILIFFQMFELWRLGRKLRESRDEFLLARHKSTVAGLGCSTLLLVALIELQVSWAPHRYAGTNPWLFGFHLLIDATLLLVVASILFRYTGLRNPIWHRRLAYTVYLLLLVSATSGSWLLYSLPS